MTNYLTSYLARCQWVTLLSHQSTYPGMRARYLAWNDQQMCKHTHTHRQTHTYIHTHTHTHTETHTYTHHHQHPHHLNHPIPNKHLHTNSHSHHTTHTIITTTKCGPLDPYLNQQLSQSFYSLNHLKYL